MTEIVRVLRVLEYIGPRRDLERVLDQNAVKGTRVFGEITIREAMIGSWPEVLGEPHAPEHPSPKGWPLK